MIGPAPILAAIVGLFHVSAYVFIRGRAGARVPFLLVAAILGAWAGDAVGARMGIDPVRIGEFNVLSASVMAWLAIAIVALVAVIVPERTGPRERVPITTSLQRRARADAEAGAAEAAGDAALPTDLERDTASDEPGPDTTVAAGAGDSTAGAAR